MTLYYRLCLGLTDIGQLYPIETSPYSIVENLDQEVFKSVYLYSEDQFREATKMVQVVNKRTGEIVERPRGVGILTLADGTQLETLSGISNQLIFDFDCKDDLEKAKADTIEVINRLKKWGIPEKVIDIYYSGGKGFNLKVHLNQFLTSTELHSICTSLIDGLETADTVVYNDSRIVRLPYSKHGKSGLYCTPITIDELVNLKIDDIKAIAAVKYSPEEFPTRIDIPEELLKLKDLKPSEKKKTETKIIGSSFEDMKDKISKLDFSKKMPLMSAAKWVLQQGFIPAGHGQEARMILAATYKAMGLDENEAYYQLKATSKKRAKLLGKAYEFDKSELYNNVIATVYSESWQGGTYSADHPLLATIEQYIPSFLRSPKEAQTNITTKEEAFAEFVDYSKEIDDNTILFGIPSLDRNLRILTKNVYSLLGSPGSGKCHTRGTKILMYDGSIKKVEDVVVGDLLMGNDSTPRKVLSLARGKDYLYNIIPNSGAEIYGVNESHILSLKVTRDGIFGKKRGEVINVSVRDYLHWSNHNKKRTQGYKAIIDFKENKLEFDPYFVGLWIGDGTIGKTQITKPDIEIHEYLKELADSYGYRITIHDTERCPMVSIVDRMGHSNQILDFCRTLVVDNEKRIPKEFITTTIENRKKLLAGLIDSDGYKDRENCYEISTKYYELSKQIKFIADSLGFLTHYKEKVIKYNGENRIYYVIYMSGDFTDIPIKINRKKTRISPIRRTNKNTYGFKVVENGYGDYYGFELDGNHLYCLQDCTVTHNTTWLLQVLENTSNNDNKSIYFSFDMANSDTISKILTRHTGIPDEEIMENIKSNKTEEIIKYKQILSEKYKNVEFVFKPGLNIEDMENTIRMSDRMSGKQTKLIAVDYLSLIKSSAQEANAKAIEAIQGLRYLSHSLNIAVIVLLQPNKLNSNPSEAVTTYSAIKGSSEIAEACTAIMTMYREGYDPKTYENDNTCTILCVKNRKGKLFNLDFHWDGMRGLIRELSPTERDRLKKYRADKEAKKLEEKMNRQGQGW